jgi:hypothetical protein
VSFWVQHGHGKSDKIDQLLAAAAVDGVILSPANESFATMTDTIRDLARAGVPLLFDPQAHVHSVPNATAAHHADFGLDFDSIGWGIDPLEIERHVTAVLDANTRLGLNGPVIAPTVLQRGFDDGWTMMALQHARVGLRQARAAGRDVYASVAVEEEALGNWRAISRWLDEITGLKVDGFYVVVTRGGDYPAAWRPDHLTNLMRLAYRLAVLNGYPLLFGYGDVDGLAVIAAGATGLATGWNYGQRHLRVDNWLPASFRRQPVPRITSGPLLLPLRFAGEGQDVLASRYAAAVFPDPNLRARAAPPGTWSRAQGQVQHMRVVSQLARDLAGLPVDQRPAVFRAMVRNATRGVEALQGSGISIAASHTARLRALAVATDDFVRLENLPTSPAP